MLGVCLANQTKSIKGGEHNPPITAITSSQMNTFLTAEEILQLVTTGMVTLTEDLMIRMSESYEDSEWYNDPNNVMSRHHY